MSTPPRVSVIVIFLNEQRFLPEAIESVLAQTFPSWELLLVDDGSTDGGSAIATEYARRYSDRLQVLTHPGRQNRGMSASRNLGLAHARGEFVGFLDADDLWLPVKLAEQVDILDALPDVAMVYGRTLIWHSWADGPKAGREDFVYDLGVIPDTVVRPPALLIQLIQNRFQTPTTCNALMRKRAVERVGGFEDAFGGMFEDQVFFMKMCEAHDVFVASPCWAWYRQRDDSCSAIAERSERVRGARLHLLQWLEGHLRSRRGGDPRTWQVLEAEMRICTEAPVDPVARASSLPGRRLLRDGRRALAALGRTLGTTRRT